MVLTWRKEWLDIVLVPMGLLIMIGYHLFLLYRCLKLPRTPIIGYMNHNKRAWVDRMIQVEGKERSIAISVMNNQVSAATSMSSISLLLTSLIGAWLGSYSRSIFTSSLIYGDTSPTVIPIKYIALLSCFMVAFCSFVEAARCYILANFLISTPNTDIPAICIENAVIRGSFFWAIGLRALYFTTTLLLWVFDPIPMFVCSVIMVVALHNLDRSTTPLH